MGMAPKGIEGTTLALTTTVGNAGQTLANFITMGLGGMFALTRDDLQADSMHTRFQYMYNSLAVMAIQCFFMLFFCWMPKSMADAKAKYMAAPASNSWRWFATLLVVFSVVWGSGTTVFALFCPDNSIIGGDAGIGACKA